MNRVEQWILNRIIRKEVRQDRNHKGNLNALYRIIRDAIDDEFLEDNNYTKDGYRREIFEETQHFVKNTEL
jgi:hypothetical protein